MVVVHAGEVAPAGVAAQLDQPGAKLDPKRQPAEQEQHEERRRGARVAQEDREESRLEQDGFPSEPVELLADVDDREIEHPEGQPHQHRQPERPSLRETGHGRGGEDEPRHRHRAEEAVGVVEVEQARRFAEAGVAEEARGREQAVLAKQGGNWLSATRNAIR
jgi:hypothetical protein